MRVAFACDHAGFSLKEPVLAAVRAAGHQIIDCGTDSTAPVDYPDYALALGRVLQECRADRGILLCGSGVGACVAANKMLGIRAGVCHDTYSAAQGVKHDDLNVLCLGGRVVGEALAVELVRAFLGATFSNEERHLRRLRKVLEIEQANTPRR